MPGNDDGRSRQLPGSTSRDGGLPAVAESPPGRSGPGLHRRDGAAAGVVASPATHVATDAEGVGDTFWRSPTAAHSADDDSTPSVASLTLGRGAAGTGEADTTHRVSTFPAADAIADLLGEQVPPAQPEPSSSVAGCRGDDCDLLGAAKVAAINASFASSHASSVAAPALWPPGGPTTYPSPLPHVPSPVDSQFPQDPSTCSSPLLGGAHLAPRPTPHHRGAGGPQGHSAASCDGFVGVPLDLNGLYF